MTDDTLLQDVLANTENSVDRLVELGQEWCRGEVQCGWHAVDFRRVGNQSKYLAAEISSRLRIMPPTMFLRGFAHLASTS